MLKRDTTKQVFSFIMADRTKGTDLKPSTIAYEVKSNHKLRNKKGWNKSNEKTPKPISIMRFKGDEGKLNGHIYQCKGEPGRKSN